MTQPTPTPNAPGSLIEQLRFMFAVGIECSCPTIADGRRMDELELTGHYKHWRTDLQIVRDLNVKYLRYGLPIHRVFKGPGDYDWSFPDAVMAWMRELRIIPILDLVHFGLPDWMGSFQNPDWPRHAADYARAVAERYPWVRFFTPVNEVYITAQFSAAFGWWNERLRSEKAFVTNLKHSAEASIRMMLAILETRPLAIFVFSESTEYVHPASPDLVDLARFLNERRFLSLDLLLGNDVSAKIYAWLLECGMTATEYVWFHSHPQLKPHCIMGSDYYITNEHVLQRDGRTVCTGDIYGYYVITKQYYDRYRVPVMHTETNRAGAHATAWLWKEWMNLLRLREDGVPIIGFTWYGLVDMIDWDSALTNPRGHVNPVGLYTLNRRPRKVATEFRKLINEYSPLPISNSNFALLTS